MAWYEYPMNFSGGQNVTGIGSLFVYSNYVTGGILGNVILGVIFLISFLTMKNYTSSKAIAASMFITTVFAVLFARIGMVHPAIPIGTIILTIAGLLWASYERPYAI